MKFEVEPLVEIGTPVTTTFRDGEILAQRDRNSGYVFFPAPTAATLHDYYQQEHPSTQRGSQTVGTDYEPAKNGYHGDRVIEAFRAATGRVPATSFEFGGAFGGLVAEFVSRGVRRGRQCRCRRTRKTHQGQPQSRACRQSRRGAKPARESRLHLLNPPARARSRSRRCRRRMSGSADTLRIVVSLVARRHVRELRPGWIPQQSLSEPPATSAFPVTGICATS